MVTLFYSDHSFNCLHTSERFFLLFLAFLVLCFTFFSLFFSFHSLIQKLNFLPSFHYFLFLFDTQPFVTFSQSFISCFPYRLSDLPSLFFTNYFIDFCIFHFKTCFFVSSYTPFMPFNDCYNVFFALFIYNKKLLIT